MSDKDMEQQDVLESWPYLLSEGDTGQQDALDVMRLDEVHRRHIIALGLIADLSANLEWQVRLVMGLSLGIDDETIIDALFLGERFGMIAQRLEALAKAPDVYNIKAPGEFDFELIVEWTKKGRRAMEKRDALIHRPLHPGPAGLKLGRARRSQTAEMLAAQAPELVTELVKLRREGNELIWDLSMG